MSSSDWRRHSVCSDPKAGMGKLAGHLARPMVDGPLPAVVLVPRDRGLTQWMKQCAGEIASIGYVVLAVDCDEFAPAGASPLVRAVVKEPLLERLGAAVDWLAARPFVDPERIGAVGWSSGAACVLELASRRNLKAAVVCDGSVCSTPEPLLQLRTVPVLVIAGHRDEGCTPQRVAELQKLLAASQLPHVVRVLVGAGGQFMDSSRADVYVEEAAELAWVEIYEFLGHYVEDADLLRRVLSGDTQEPIARIVDIMRVT